MQNVDVARGGIPLDLGIWDIKKFKYNSRFFLLKEEPTIRYSMGTIRTSLLTP